MRASSGAASRRGSRTPRCRYVDRGVQREAVLVPTPNLAAFITATITEHQGVTSLEYDGGVDAAGCTIDIPAELRGSAAGALFAEGDEDALPAAVLRCLKK